VLVFPESVDWSVVVMCDIGYVNQPAIICKNPKVTAINSCIEVDITGQVVSDSIGDKFYSGEFLALGKEVTL